jgi:hypothetical protein
MYLAEIWYAEKERALFIGSTTRRTCSANIEEREESYFVMRGGTE